MFPLFNEGYISFLSIIHIKLFFFISDAEPKKASRRIRVVKKKVVSVLKREHLNVTKAGEIMQCVEEQSQ